MYTTWTGEGILGPRAGEFLEPYPAFWSVVSSKVFTEQFIDVVEDCLVFEGEERLGVGCHTVCPELIERCPNKKDICSVACAVQPRAAVDCMRDLDHCEIDACPLQPFVME